MPPESPRVPRRVGKSPSGSSGGGGESRSAKSSKSSSKSDDNAAMKWVVRGIVGALLIGLLITAAFDFSKKGQMGRTGNAWTKALEDSGTSGQPLKFSTLEPMIEGSPTRTERAAAGAATNINKSKVYSYVWSGPFRTYKIDLDVEEEPGGGETVTKVNVGGAAQ